MPTTRQFPTPDTSPPLPKLRKDLSAPGLLRAIRGEFAKIADARRGCVIPLDDALMAGLGVFGLKYPSLRQFDPVEPEALRGAFRAVHRQLQRHKGLEPYGYWQGHSCCGSTVPGSSRPIR